MFRYETSLLSITKCCESGHTNTSSKLANTHNLSKAATLHAEMYFLSSSNNSPPHRLFLDEPKDSDQFSKCTDVLHDRLPFVKRFPTTRINIP